MGFNVRKAFPSALFKAQYSQPGLLHVRMLSLFQNSLTEKIIIVEFSCLSTWL